MGLHRFGDLVLDSGVPLPVLPPAERHPPDLAFRVEPGASEDDSRWDHHWRDASGSISLSCSRLPEGGYRLGAAGLATFEVEHEGRSVTGRPRDGLPASTFEHLVVDQVLPRVLAYRGRLVLHAGCVLTEHGAVGFLGESGAGKSTLCASFDRGGEGVVLGDDGIVVRESDDGFREAIPTYPGLRLLPDALRFFGGESGALPVAHYTPKGRIAPSLGSGVLAGTAVRLRVLYVLARAPARSERAIPRIEPVPPRDALLAVLGSLFQLHLGDPRRARRCFEDVTRLVASLPVRRLDYPDDLEALPTVRSTILADLR